MAFTVRETARDDWHELRELRLAALLDPVAPVAFYEPYADALLLPRADWEDRAAPRPDRTTFVGGPGEGPWAGMLVVFRRTDFVQVAGVYVLPAHRGTGLARQLMRAAISWAGDCEVRLHVHENNRRAARFYTALGFLPTGAAEADPLDPALRAYELALRPESRTRGERRPRKNARGKATRSEERQ
ncbi:GNAT family N-acetyltransferase [Streptomyces sp. ACA25]|uniref:GNAT family N-acetyltransferase n=1 Tax=Streptomyces sp. ACA25 TaxID=3022596 RepID=UPI002307E9A1|nr:GNAT family N-acetyltransferase [Streptomyces sp. ACA25]MDB1090213.1 GNAT family N-acetyltransferase [Streptomyces sp. ACA25]